MSSKFLLILFLIKISKSSNVNDSEEFEFVAKVQDLMFESPRHNYIICGGIIISNKNVLVPLRCVLHFGNVFTIRRIQVEVGTRNTLNCDGLCATLRAKQIYFHPKYQEDPDTFNLAIIVSKQIQFHHSLQPANISDVKEVEALKPGDSCLIAGWLFRYQGEIPPTLQTGLVQIAESQMCAKIPGFNIEYMICVNASNSSNIAREALGGPLVCNGKVVGILSYLESHEFNGSYFAYCKIEEYMDWILSPTHIIIAKFIYIITIITFALLFITCSSSYFYLFGYEPYMKAAQLGGIMGQM